MLNKSSEKGKCPFRNLKPCSEKCVLYRKGVRFNELKSESYPIEECALNLMCDSIEAMHQRGYMLQKEVGDMKNVATMKILHDLKKCSDDDMDRAIKTSLKLQGEKQELLQ